MGRPHIEFIQSQVLPWTPSLGPARPDVEARILSVDDDTGACSAVVRYPPGWRRDAELLAVDEAFYVLDGELRIGGTVYGADTFAHLPAGHRRDAAAAPAGAVTLAFYSGPVDTADEGMATPDPARLVTRIDVADGAWEADLEAMGLAAISTGARTRVLFTDPASGEMTYLTGTMPFRHERHPERHPVGQEFYILSGELAGNCGLMHAGAYCWRPPMVTHGPYGSRTGALILLRSVGGPLTTELDPPVPYRFDVTHRPVLPPELQALGQEPWPARPRY